MGGKGSGGYNKGKNHSIETRKKMSLKAKGRKHSEKTKKLLSKIRKGTHIGKDNPRWKGGKYKDSLGYKYIYCPSHPKPKNGRYVAEHRLVMEKNIKRFLNKLEVIHHIDLNKSNNKIKNLFLFKNAKSHRKCHEYLERVGAQLFKKGIIIFEDGKYKVNEEFKKIQK